VDVNMNRALRLVEESRDYLLSKAGMLPDWLSPRR
jgi:hypothetical protein